MLAMCEASCLVFNAACHDAAGVLGLLTGPPLCVEYAQCCGLNSVHCACDI